MKTIIAKPWEAAALAAGRKTLWLRPVKPEPHPSLAYAWETAFHHDSEYSREPGATMSGWPVIPDRWWFCDASGPRSEYRCPFGRVGEQIGVKEVHAFRQDSEAVED